MSNNNLTLLAIVIVVLGGAYFLYTNSSEEGDMLETGEENNMTFFVTSRNSGTGANFGGLEGADAHCQLLAEEAGTEDLTWRAYLSANGEEEVVHARDRIGTGPWYNANGVLIAQNLEDLHGSANVINKETGLDENGNMVNGRGDTPNVHDILTGSNPDGTLAIGEGDTTCSDWTSESEDGSAVVGHHDRVGLDESDAAKSWNSSHGSRGCSLPNLNSTGGGGLLYCFAVSE